MKSYDYLVSVIVPVYKVEKYLDRCVSSIVRQTYENLEIILVDDGSPDNCPATCDSWSKRDNRITVVHRNNGGQSAARNSALKIAKGDYIVFVDSDDWITETLIEDNLKLLVDVGADMVCFNYWTAKNENELQECIKFRKIHTQQDTIDNILLRKGPVSVWSKMYSCHVWDDLRFREKIVDEDWYIMPDVLVKARKIIVNENCCYYYNIGNVISTTFKPKTIEFYYEFLCIGNTLNHIEKLAPRLEDFFRNEQFKRALKIYEYNLLSGHFGDKIIGEVRSFICYDKRLNFANKLRWLDFATIRLMTLIKSIEYYFRIQ